MPSTYIENAIRARLLADSAVAAIVSTRVYYLEAPQNVTKPYVVFFDVSDPDKNWKVGVDGSNPRFQVESIDDNTSLTNVKALDKAVRASLRDFKGSMDGINVNYIERGKAQVFRDPENVIRLTRDFVVNYDRV
jgi:hypothetical protein